MSYYYLTSYNLNSEQNITLYCLMLNYHLWIACMHLEFVFTYDSQQAFLHLHTFISGKKMLFFIQVLYDTV